MTTLPCPDPSLPAGLTARDLDRLRGEGLDHSERYERELERGERRRRDAIEAELENRPNDYE